LARRSKYISSILCPANAKWDIHHEEIIIIAYVKVIFGHL